MRTAIVTIDHDPDVESPCEYGSWKLHSFCSRHVNYKHPSELGLGLYLGPDGLPPIENIGLKRKLEVGTAFILSYFEHGDGCWSLRGEGPQCQFDSTQIAGLLVWEGKPKDCSFCKEEFLKQLEAPGHQYDKAWFSRDYKTRASAARSFLKNYSDWANGHCYQYSIKEYDEETEEEGEDIDSCSGYIGDDIVAAIKEAAKDNDLRIVKVDGEADFMFDAPFEPEPATATA